MHIGAAAHHHLRVSDTAAGICKTGLLFCCPNLSICLLIIISIYSACDTTVTAHSLTHSLTHSCIYLPRTFTSVLYLLELQLLSCILAHDHRLVTTYTHNCIYIQMQIHRHRQASKQASIYVYQYMYTYMQCTDILASEQLEIILYFF